MADYFYYIIEATICLSLFYLFYKYFFYKYTYFQWNRIYFIATALFSLILPFVYIPLPFEISNNAQAINNFLSFNPISNNSILIFQFETDSFKIDSFNDLANLGNLIALIYFSGLILHMVRFILNVMAVIRVTTFSEKRRKGKLILINTDSNLPTFSFWRFVFLNEDFKALVASEKEMIFQHEKIHATQLHSLDVVFFEVLTAVFWFNPLMKSIKYTLSEIHEYIADSTVVKNKVNKPYAHLLLRLAGKGKKLALANNFSKSQVKRRIMMLSKPEPNKLRKSRFLIALPVLVFSLVIFTGFKGIYKSFNTMSSHKKRVFPLVDNAELIMGFYENKKVNKGSTNKNTPEYKVSHREQTYMVGSFMDVLSPVNGQVVEIKQKDNWGLKGYTAVIQYSYNEKILVKGMAKILIKKGIDVNQGQVIGKTGDKRLYPTITIQVLIDNKPVDPFLALKR